MRTVQQLMSYAGLIASVGLALGLGGCKPAEQTEPGPVEVASETPSGVAQTPPVSTEHPGETIENPLVADFDAAWEIVRDSHFDPDYNGVDWEAVRVELRPEALEADDQGDIRRVITRMLGRLGQSHFGLIPADVADPVSRDDDTDDDADDDHDAEAKNDSDGGHGDDAHSTADRPEPRNAEGQHTDGEANPGMTVRLVGGQVVVTEVDPDGAAAGAGVHAGWAVVEVGKVGLAEMAGGFVDSVGEADAPLYVSQSVDGLLAGEDGSHARVLFLDGEDRFVDLDLRRDEPDGPLVKFGNLPPILTEFETRWIERDGLRIGYIYFSIWMMPIMPQFEKAMIEFKEADGIILDMRGNLGGIGGLAMGVGRYFFDEEVDLGTMKMRNNEMHFNVRPIKVTPSGARLDPFDGPVALVIDSVSASTTEVFGGGMQSLGRARVFGERSAGAALPALMSKLPSGDVLLHAMASFVSPSGALLEDTGVVPDEPLVLTRENLLSGKDTPLEAALSWMVKENE